MEQREIKTSVERWPGKRGLHLLALLTAAATFPLIFMGGLVTSHGAGMSVPDWPNSYGYNMFLFPPRLWIGGILYEHTHRLMGTVVGFLSILLVICAFRVEKKKTVRWLATAILGMVIFQGILGGLRVVLVKLNLAIVHACVAQAFFCLAALFCVVTSKWWENAPSFRTLTSRIPFTLGVIAVSVIYLQLVAGAVMRHYEAGLAVTDFPLIYHRFIPPTTTAELKEINHQRAWAPEPANVDPTAAFQLSRPVTLAQIWIHSAHRYGAVLVSLAVIAFAISIFRSGRRRGTVVMTAFLLLLLISQIALGACVVLLHKPADVTSLHVAIGALTLVTTFVLTVRMWRLSPSRSQFAISDSLPHGARFAVR